MRRRRRKNNLTVCSVHAGIQSASSSRVQSGRVVRVVGSSILATLFRRERPAPIRRRIRSAVSPIAIVRRASDCAVSAACVFVQIICRTLLSWKNKSSSPLIVQPGTPRDGGLLIEDIVFDLEPSDGTGCGESMCPASAAAAAVLLFSLSLWV